MFEKEAEEFERRKHYRYEDNDYCGDIADGIIQAYQQGAEFGYNKANEELEEKIKVKKLEILELKSQIKKMKCDVIFLIKDRMNDDIDQNIIERLAEKWEVEQND